ncbi:MAG: RMD1 family protein [Myxococcota bacterium]|nr:RMD1 family protein [Myxococcota bacterium]
MSATELSLRAFAVAATLQPRSVEALFGTHAKRCKLTKTAAVASYGPTSWVAAYDFGAVVFIGVEENQRRRIIRDLVDQLGTEPRAPLEETFAVEIDRGATPAVRFDRAIVRELDVRVVEIVSLVVAQSVAMEYYEGDVDALIGALEALSKKLALHGALRTSPREMLRFIGRGMMARTQVVRTLSLLESPVATWDDEALDRLYRGLRSSFEIEERYRALDHELRVVQDNLVLMVDLVHQRRFILLEIAVTIFVAAELVILLGQVALGWKAGP